jgi:glycerol-3-phosphate acyltransferase PlsY
MPPLVDTVVLTLLAYLVGAIPSGYIAGKLARGIDLREHGSRNIGFTNAWRVLGWKWAVPVLVADIGKAWGAVAGGAAWAGVAPSSGLGVLLGSAVLVGNLANVFLRFRGGKGVAAAAGVYAAVSPWGILGALVAWGVVLGVTRYMSLASITGAVVLPVVTAWKGGVDAVFWFALATSVIVILKHRANISRLRNGTEVRIGHRTPPGAERRNDG